MYFRKLIIFVFINLVFALSYVFASTELDISINSNKLDINDILILEVDIFSDGNGDLSIKEIKGIDNFEIIGKGQSNSIRNINGDINIVYNLTFNLKAKQKGEYILGPIILEQNGEEKDFGEAKKIEITGEKIFIGNKPKLPNASSDIKKEDLKEEEKSDFFKEEDIDSDSNQIDLQEKNGTGGVINLDGNSMRDIYDIKKNNFISPINLVWSLFYIVFFVIVYLLYKLYLKQKSIVVKKVEKIVEEKEEIDYLSLIKNIEANYLNGEKHKFYAQVSSIIRLYLDDKVEAGLSAKTLKEIKGNINLEFYNLIEKIYFPEYDNKKDDTETRRYILEQIKIILTK